MHSNVVAVGSSLVVFVHITMDLQGVMLYKYRYEDCSCLGRDDVCGFALIDRR
jgi:hypothetical protein